jgi:hypothetical protein
MECWWCHRRGHMKRDCNKWNRAGKPQGPRIDVANVVVDHSQQSNIGAQSKHQTQSWIIRKGHGEQQDLCLLLNVDMCLTMIEDDKEIHKMNDKIDTYID